MGAEDISSGEFGVDASLCWKLIVVWTAGVACLQQDRSRSSLHQKKGGMQFEVLNDPTEEIVPAGSLVGIKDIDFVGRSEAETP